MLRRPTARVEDGEASARVHAGGPGTRAGLAGATLTVLMILFFSLRAFVHFTNALVTALTASR